MKQPHKINVSDVGFAYDGTIAVEGVTFDVEAGEFVCIVGPSGCGKSTMLKVLAGFIPPTEGGVFVDGTRISGPSRDRGIVFQEHALFPWKTVAANILFGPSVNDTSVSEQQDILNRLLDLVGLRGFEQRYPHQLSGGEQQRIALCRALANRPSLLLLDEPFGEVDALTRLKLQKLLLNIWEQLKLTIVLVTHDLDESILLGDRIIIMAGRPGRVVDEVAVTLPRPRAIQMLIWPELVSVKGHLLTLLEEQ